MATADTNKDALLKVFYGAGKDESKVVSAYEELADAYHDEFSIKTYMAPSKAAETAASLIKCDEKKRQIEILDFGAGTGLSGTALKECGFSTIDALDVSRSMLDVAQAKSNGELYREIFVGNLKDDPDLVKESTYDMVVGVGVIGTHVVDIDDVQRVMSLVKPGGYLVYTIMAEADKTDSFQNIYDSFQQDQEGKSEGKSNGIINTQEWSVAQSKDVGSLMVDHPAVKHRIVVLQRMP
mmetsp:Transcript_25531/g.33304  ORF Transcript_25531/g.33304 Transcript_25531/m.33304 type:complete len:238 (-) Transcript_25531:304-1017(-)|eukprot:CAMPEP_0195286806 /NCGR_PEP_ID=MMETSP0707-20130614/4129_1 /TAXON_ID=33640 /ORGANISM="Asterionellopsis glacialis, Strain CCMP134" /LENGTH=237 /DNA_ID=CAMNT_0040346495 /DNA_START=44 /DNA_END=757 /DNA_ORIENTATION=+